VRAIEGASAREAKATTSVLKRSLAQERERIWASIGTGGIYRSEVVFQTAIWSEEGRN